MNIIQKNQNLKFNYVDAGVYVVKKKLLNKLKNKIFHLKNFFFKNLLIKKNRLYRNKKFFYDIGTKEK